MNIKCTTTLVKDFNLLLSEAISSAKNSIQIICFEVSSKTIINHLIQISNEGVAVKIICEERKAGRELFNWAEKDIPNVDIKFSNPNEYYYALHEKLILIDDSVAIFGSFNLSETSLNENIEILFETSERRFIQQINKQISYVEQVVNSTQNPHKNKISNIVKDKRAGFLSNKKEESHIIFSDDYSLHKIICDLLSKAKRTITVFASHHISKELLDLLHSKSMCNVKVNIVVDYSVLNRVLVFKKLNNLLRYVSVNGKMHTKAILIDNNTYLVGSVNLFERSLIQDQEFLLIGRNPVLNKVIRDHLYTIFDMSKPLSFNVLWSLKLKSYKSKAKNLLKKALNLPAHR